VVYVTVARPNRTFLQLLLQRRRLLQTLFLYGSMLTSRAQPVPIDATEGQSSLNSANSAPGGANPSSSKSTSSAAANGGAGTVTSTVVPAPPPVARRPLSPRRSAMFELAQLKVEAAAERSSGHNLLPSTAAAARARSSTQAHEEAMLSQRTGGGANGASSLGGHGLKLERSRQGGTSVDKDAPWLTGAHVDQVALLSPAEVRKKERARASLSWNKTKSHKIQRSVTPTRIYFDVAIDIF